MIALPRIYVILLGVMFPEDSQITGRHKIPINNVEKTAMIKVSRVGTPSSKMDGRFGGKKRNRLAHRILGPPIRAQSVPRNKIKYRDPMTSKQINK